MSGFEIAGVVFGAVSVLGDISKVLRRALKDAHTFWYFERELADFSQDVEREYICYSQIISILLEPIDEIPEEEREILKMDSDSLLWQEPRIKQALSQNFPVKNRKWILGQLKDVTDTSKGLWDKLESKEFGIERFLNRIRTSFSHEKNRLLDRIHTRNQDLFEFLQRDQMAQTTRRSARSKSVINASMSFLDFQKQARSVFEGFRYHWVCNCRCAGTHPCDISAQESDIRVLLGNGAKRTHMKVQLEATETLLSDPGRTSPAAGETVPDSRKPVLPKSELEKARDNSPAGTTNPNPSTPVTISEPANAKNAHSRNDDLGKPPGKQTKIKESRGTHPTVRHKRVQFTLADQSPAPMSPTPSRPVPVVTSTISGRGHQISNMCLAVENQQSSDCIGFLQLQDAKLFLYQGTPSHAELPKTATLEEFIKAMPKRDCRLELGLAIVHTVLKLGVHWVPGNWHKSTLILQAHGPDDDLPRPYISHPSIHWITTAPESRAKETTRTIFEVLGILLLELLLGDSIEHQPFRTMHMGPGEKPTYVTEFAVVAEWQKKARDDFGVGIADAIARCIYCSFDESKNLGNAKFVQSVLTTVAEPLNEYVRVFRNGV